MCQLYLFIATRLTNLGDAVPQTPWDLSRFGCSSRRGPQTEPGGFRKSHPALLLLAASRRRSGCVPAEPCPPLECAEFTPSPSADKGAPQKSGFARTSGFENYKVSGFANYSRPVLLAPQHK